ncbi:MAG: type II toxin-antitoxin system RelE/ParE family toxin [Eubacteriales bacterium]|nr:type II toxin-antitoxin system RelE/ParE family toxin [Eubacteriales bacterium]MDD4744041.1 type II toxin-antitoxin system RelE/ParE family toxin [Eubacteriales bacterium]
MDWDLELYRKENGSIPVKDFLISLSPKLRAKAYSDILLLKKLGANIREPFSTAIKGERYKGLYELRIKFSSDISRIFYFLYNKNNIILLHGYLKKTNKTPKRELEKALRYKINYESRNRNE